MRLSRLKVIGSFFLAGALSVPAWAARTAQPGSLNYVEGHAAIGDQPLDAQSIGSTALQPGQSLTTSTVKAEILLTPGVFLSLDDASYFQNVPSSLTNIQVTLDQ